MNKKEFFNQMAHAWDESFSSPEMKERLTRLVSLFQLRSGARILDAGAGTGGLIPYLLKAAGREASVWDVDFAGEMVRAGKKKFLGNERVFFAVAAVESVPFETGSFDHAICFGAFPHFEDKRRALNEMNRVLKDSGTLLIAHALSSAEIRHHHQNCAPVSRDFLPEEGEMKALLQGAGFRLNRLIDQSKCYVCEGIKLSSIV